MAIEGRDEAGAPSTVDIMPGDETAAVACITVAAAGGEAVAPDRLLDRIMRVVRSDDQVCPVWSGGCVVSFGSTARSVLPETLAERMVEAIEGLGSPDLVVSVGMASASRSIGLDVLTRRSVSASRSGHTAITRSTGPTAVTVLDRDCASTTPGNPVRRRSKREASLSGLSHLQWRHHPTPLAAHGGDAPRPTLLLLDSYADAADGSGPVARSIHYRAETFGYDTVLASLGTFSATLVDEVHPSLMVIALDHAPSRTAPVSWVTSSWCVASAATKAAVRRRTPVLAVSSREAGALAACVNHGATAVFGLGDIDSHLDPSPTADPGGAPCDRPPGAYEQRPPGFDALLTLTDSERRVLFYLTGGWSAQSIADELVVSLTTVRSHIRSTLRKLGVRSQLAAVAIANGLDVEATRRPEYVVAAGRH